MLDPLAARSKKKVFKKKPYNYNVAKYKIRYNASAGSDASGIIDAVFSTSDPEGAVDNAGVYSDWTSLEGLWDNYKVTGLKLQYIPYKAADDSTITTFRSLYIIQDDDDTSTVTSITEAIQYEKFIVKDLTRPFTLFFKVAKPTVTDNPQGWMNLGNAGSSSNRIGAVKFYADSLTASHSYGNVVLTMYVTCMGRR